MLLFRFLLLFISSITTIFTQQEKYAAIVVDGKTGKVLHGINCEEKRYPASLAKKMTLYLIFEALQQKKITMQTRFNISVRASRQAPSKLGLQPGDSISVEQIIKSLIVKSANDAAVVIAEGLSGSVENFAQLMTQKAKQLGMNNTVFVNSCGINDAGTNDKRQYSTAKDLAILAIALYRDFPMYAHLFKMKTFHFNGKVIHTHNHMLENVQGVDGLKTGFANAPGFNISTSVIRYNQHNEPQRLFVVVMGGHSWRSRDRHAEELIEYGYNLLNSNQKQYAPQPQFQLISARPTKLKIQKISARSLSARKDIVDQFIKKNQKKKISSHIFKMRSKNKKK